MLQQLKMCLCRGLCVWTRLDRVHVCVLPPSGATRPTAAPSATSCWTSTSCTWSPVARSCTTSSSPPSSAPCRSPSSPPWSCASPGTSHTPGGWSLAQTAELEHSQPWLLDEDGNETSLTFTCTSPPVLQEVQPGQTCAETEAAPGPLSLRDLLQDDVAPPLRPPTSSTTFLCIFSTTQTKCCFINLNASVPLFFCPHFADGAFLLSRFSSLLI